MKNLIAILSLAAAAAFSQGSGILELNPREKVLPVLLSARECNPVWGGGPDSKSLTLLHFSDLHGSCENLKRIVEFYDAYSGYIEDAVHTGDVVSCYLDDPNPWTMVKGAGRIINVIGNHDCWKGHKTWAESPVPYDASAEDAYKVFIGPFVAGWNVTQPCGVDDRGSEHFCGCYFYKDYPESGVRLIAIDGIHYDSVQDEWLARTLSDAASKGLAVIAAEHYFSQTGLRSIDSGFSTKASIAACADPERPQIECMRESVFDTVDRFIDGGGTFVCWLSGHEHEDYIGYVAGHERQLQILVAKAGEKDVYIHENRSRGTVNQDAFNLVTVNPSKNLLTIQRIGCNRGARMRPKTLFCYDYITAEVVVNE